MGSMIHKLQDGVRGLSRAEGGNETGIPFVTAWHFTRERIQMSKTENPYLYIVLDGMIRLYRPSGMMDYMAGQYSISKIGKSFIIFLRILRQAMSSSMIFFRKNSERTVRFMAEKSL